MQHSWKRTFSIIWVGQFLSLVSSSAVNFAIIIWLTLETKSAEVLALAAIAGMLPQAIIGPVAGVFVDRWDRKKTMMYADGFIAICTAIMAINFSLGNNSLFMIYILLALRSVGSAFHMPSMQATIPLLAPQDQLLRIAGINQVIQSVSTIAGPALGAFAITVLPIGHVLWIDIIGAVIAITSLLLVHIPNPLREEKEEKGVKEVLKDINIGLTEITRNIGVKWLFLYSVVVTFCIMPVAILFPLLTTDHFGGDKVEMSIIEITWGVGMLVGGGILGVFKPSMSKIALINLTSIVLGLSLSMSGYISSSMFMFFIVLTGIAGIAASIYNASFMTILQEEIAPEKLGRVFSMYFSLAVFPSIIGLLSTGFVADFIGINRTFIILGLVIAVLGIIAFFIPDLMRLGKPKNER